MSTIIDTPTVHTETRATRQLRDLDAAAVRLMQEALSSPLITEGQRTRAWEAFYATEDWSQRMKWSRSITTYTNDVRKGLRLARPDVQDAEPVTPELVAAVEAAAVAERECVAQADEVAAEPVQPVQPVEETAEAVEPEVAMPIEVAAEPVQPVEVAAEAVAVVPMWASTSLLEALPSNLIWSGKQVPGVGESLLAVRGGRTLKVTVDGYFHAEGFMGIVAKFEGKVPERLLNCPRSKCFFGSEVRAAA